MTDPWRANLIPGPDTLRLYLGSKRTGYAIVRDDRWPQMWRIRSPDGELSDMVNLTRAKDAALAAVGQPRGGIEWK